MKRLDDVFLKTLEHHVTLAGKQVLEVGCGNGERAQVLASRCKSFVGVDPSPKCIQAALGRGIRNAMFYRHWAESMPFRKGRFDVVLFSLSLHHVKPYKMSRAIDRAVFVAGGGTSKRGHVVFLEPSLEGSLYEAEMYFDAWDGDERQQKRAAQEAISNHTGLVLEHTLVDEVRFRFESVDDFVHTMEPKRNLEDIPTFLRNHDNELTAQRVASIFSVR